MGVPSTHVLLWTKGLETQIFTPRPNTDVVIGRFTSRDLVGIGTEYTQAEWARGGWEDGARYDGGKVWRLGGVHRLCDCAADMEGFWVG